MNRRALRKLLAEHGFTEYETPGFLGFKRKDGRDLRVFFWSNTKVADRDGTPRSTTIFCIGFEHPDAYRLAVPNVVWPSEDQPKRDWADIESELTSVILPLYDMKMDEAEARAEELADGKYALRPTP